MYRRKSFLTTGCLASALLVASLSAAADTRVAEAAKHHDLDAVRALVKQHVDVSSALPDGATALHWAALWDDASLADMLILAHANVNAADMYGVTPLSLACTNGSAALVGALLRAGANPNEALPSGETPLMTAARAGRAKAVSSLIESGADIEATETARGQNALMWAAAERHLEVVTLLIAKGAKVDARAQSGFTALLFAAQRGDSQVTDVLLRAGVNVNEAANNGMTALVLAIAADQNTHAKFLLAKGADPNLGPGYTALHLIAAEEGYVEGLDGEEGVGNGGSLWGPSKLAFITQLIDRGANVNARATRPPKGPGTIGATPFFLAAWAADPDAMRVLVTNGADPKVATSRGTTPLMVAAGVLHEAGGPNVPESRAFEAVKLCVELGNEVNAVNASHGDSPLHGAAYRGMHGGAMITEFLLARGATVDVRNKRGWTPYMLAEGLYFSTYNTTNVDTAKLLRGAGAKPFPAGFPNNTGIRSSEVWYEPGFEPATLGSDGASRVK